MSLHNCTCVEKLQACCCTWPFCQALQIVWGLTLWDHAQVHMTFTFPGEISKAETVVTVVNLKVLTIWKFCAGQFQDTFRGNFKTVENFIWCKSYVWMSLYSLRCWIDWIQAREIQVFGQASTCWFGAVIADFATGIFPSVCATHEMLSLWKCVYCETCRKCSFYSVAIVVRSYNQSMFFTAVHQPGPTDIGSINMIW